MYIFVSLWLWSMFPSPCFCKRAGIQWGKSDLTLLRNSFSRTAAYFWRDYTYLFKLSDCSLRSNKQNVPCWCLDFVRFGQCFLVNLRIVFVGYSTLSFPNGLAGSGFKGVLWFPIVHIKRVWSFKLHTFMLKIFITLRRMKTVPINLTPLRKL